MIRILAIVCFWLVAVNSHADQLTEKTQLDAAKAAVKTLAGALQAELKTAMQSGGPTAAIHVCKTRAMVLTQEVARENDLQLSRVSLKNRNPANKPNDWQKAVLVEFEHRRAHGLDADVLSWSQIADVDGVKEFRYVQAIPTGGVCLACHGTRLSPDISHALSELYPDDRATGFVTGEIRGAFVVTRTLEQ